MLSIEQITPSLTWRLRRDVLYPGQKTFEMEMDEDNYGIHFGAFKDDRLAGVVSLFKKGADFQFRKLAVDPSVQNMGIGSSLLQHIIKHAEENNGARIWCNARITAINFYLKADFICTGKLSSKNGYNYETMEKLISPSSLQQ